MFSLCSKLEKENVNSLVESTRDLCVSKGIVMRKRDGQSPTKVCILTIVCFMMHIYGVLILTVQRFQVNIHHHPYHHKFQKNLNKSLLEKRTACWNSLKPFANVGLYCICWHIGYIYWHILQYWELSVLEWGLLRIMPAAVIYPYFSSACLHPIKSVVDPLHGLTTKARKQCSKTNITGHVIFESLSTKSLVV